MMDSDRSAVVEAGPEGTLGDLRGCAQEVPDPQKVAIE